MTAPTLDTLVGDVYALLQYGHQPTAELLKGLGSGVSTVLAESLEGALEPREGRLRLSGIGKPSRQLHYSLTDAPREAFNGETLFKFQYGHLLEEVFLYLAREAGHVVEDEQREITFEGITGHCDAKIDGVLCDVKTASPYGYQKFLDGSIRENDGFNYIPQLAAYYKGGDYTGGAAFIAINKVNGAICVCYFSHEEMMEVDVAAHAKRQKRVADNLHRVPTRCHDPVPDGKSGNLKLPTPCAYCAFKYHCHRDANNGQGLKTYVYSNGPRFLTNVAREPKVFDVPPPELITNKDT